jgi:hypothetical protein
MIVHIGTLPSFCSTASNLSVNTPYIKFWTRNYLVFFASLWIISSLHPPSLHPSLLPANGKWSHLADFLPPPLLPPSPPPPPPFMKSVAKNTVVYLVQNDFGTYFCFFFLPSKITRWQILRFSNASEATLHLISLLVCSFEGAV